MIFLEWLARLAGRRQLSRPLHVCMYTRRGCHLCETAWEQLQHAQRKYGFILSSVDVDTDPGLAARYGQEVPVVTVDGKVRFRGVINGVLLQRLLDGERGALAP